MSNTESIYHPSCLIARPHSAPDDTQIHPKNLQYGSFNNLAEIAADRRSLPPECFSMKEDIHHRAIASASKIPQLIKHPQYEDIQKNSTRSEGSSTSTKSDSGEFSINDSTKDSKKSCSCTCCMMENEKIKAHIKDLRDRIQILAVELIKCKNSNQLLKKDITTARAVVKREIGGNVENFEDLLKKAQEHGWKGHQEQILSLKKELRELRGKLKEKDVSAPSPVKRHQSLEDVPKDRKTHWRLKLEQQNVYSRAGRKIEELIEDRDKLKNNLHILKNKNKELEHQIDCIREQLDATSKDENDVFLSRLREIEKKTKFCLEDKSKLKRALDKEKTKENLLLGKITELETETNSHKKVYESTEKTLASRKNDGEKLIFCASELDCAFVNDLCDINTKLFDVDAQHKQKLERLNLLVNTMLKFEEIYTEQQQRSDLSSSTDVNKMSITTMSTDTYNEEDKLPLKIIGENYDRKSSPGRFEKQEQDSIVEDVKNELMCFANIDHHKCDCSSEESENLALSIFYLFENQEYENFQKSQQIYQVIEDTKIRTEDFLRSHSKLWKTVAHIKIMMYKNNQLRVVAKHNQAVTEDDEHGFCHTTWDELIAKGKTVFHILKKENRFLKELIVNTIGSKANDFDLNNSFACKSKEFFAQRLSAIAYEN
ncbi:uncharacterized protein CDAR_177031 [Caerostris darwini]|uniref:Uncharacterized protein n=1 Tax=Caerostris darwini TaxID=1538125 RepID=A0AAV4UBI5_9ARAC|nr:uncharacterized protein CDAR_177031 [Caerostris darwini]